VSTDIVSTWEELCLFLDGSPTSFTGLLLTLITKADPGNRARLREGFPRQVAAWEAWCEHAPLTRERLDALSDAREKTGGRFSFSDLAGMFYLLGPRPEQGHAKARDLRYLAGKAIGVTITPYISYRDGTVKTAEMVYEVRLADGEGEGLADFQEQPSIVAALASAREWAERKGITP
jgi:hypothetical protein